MCQVLGVKRQGYQQWFARQQAKKSDPNRQRKLQLVKEIADDTNHTYGQRRIQKALGVCGLPVSRGETKRLMQEANVQVRYRKKYKVTTQSNHKQPVFENVLNRQFDVKAPDQVYAADITYLWTQEGWLYLAVVIDLYSRKIVGWSMSTRMKATLVCDALTMAIWQRRPKPGLIVHSDRGVQYASRVYRKLLKKHDFIGSMSRKGDCWDNAVVESFFGTLKQERVQWNHYQTRWECQQDVLQYITMFYNEKRLHSKLGYMSPNQYEMQGQNDQLVA